MPTLGTKALMDLTFITACTTDELMLVCPDLAPADFFLFHKVKTTLKVRHHGTLDDAKRACTRALTDVRLGTSRERTKRGNVACRNKPISQNRGGSERPFFGGRANGSDIDPLTGLFCLRRLSPWRTVAGYFKEEMVTRWIKDPMFGQAFCRRCVREGPEALLGPHQSGANETEDSG
ncbi:hypothetical protein TNCV_2838191 [Trichonephila clavipes]|nr:hypothetical protein TNCV_2838191 [Trichonephila clavipes]